MKISELMFLKVFSKSQAIRNYQDFSILIIMQKNQVIIFFLFIAMTFLSACTVCQNLKPSSDLSKEIYCQNIQTNSFFDSAQKISLVEVSNRSLGNRQWSLAYATDTLIKTSDFATNSKALVAINGGFFNMREGGSVTYLEVDDQVINFTDNEADRWAKGSPVVEGALIITDKNSLKIGANRRAAYYQRSRQEKAVLITGPILLQKGRRSSLANTDFINKRHPRSCVCETFDHRILLVAVDGRSPDAAGMSLPELQEFLLLKNCKNAINLDGGGSTTLWTKEQGIVNSPSDKTGERPVANVLILSQ